MTNEPVEHSVYREMIAELNARIHPLEAELEKLARAEQRIVEVRTKLAILQKEKAEYEALLPAPTVVLSAATATPHFDE